MMPDVINHDPLKSINFFFFFNADDVTDNIELGSSKNQGKAGLASMETLDDSTKDPWNIENGETKEEEAKHDEEKKALESEEQEKPIPIWQQIRSYNCSIGNYFDMLCNSHYS